MRSDENHPHLTAKIVSKYVRHHRLASTQLHELITTVHHALGQLGKPVESGEERTPAVSVRRSVRREYVVCLECGFRGLTLRRHLRVRHRLSPDEYRQSWSLKSDHPLTAPAYSEQRSSVAKALGFGRKSTPDRLAKAPAMPQAAEPETKAPSARTSRTRRTTKPAEVTSEAAAAPMPARRGRSRSTAWVAAAESKQTGLPTAES